MINIPVANVINKTPEKVALTLSTMGSEIPLSHGWGGGGGGFHPPPGNPLGTTFDRFLYTHPKVYIQRGSKKIWVPTFKIENLTNIWESFKYNYEHWTISPFYTFSHIGHTEILQSSISFFFGSTRISLVFDLVIRTGVNWNPGWFFTLCFCLSSIPTFTKTFW